MKLRFQLPRLRCNELVALLVAYCIIYSCAMTSGVLDSSDPRARRRRSPPRGPRDPGIQPGPSVKRSRGSLSPALQPA
ncbi:hypothetical protein BJX62DRAFT_197493 [Aspergillus germanicus]